MGSFTWGLEWIAKWPEGIAFAFGFSLIHLAFAYGIARLPFATRVIDGKKPLSAAAVFAWLLTVWFVTVPIFTASMVLVYDADDFFAEEIAPSAEILYIVAIVVHWVLEWHERRGSLRWHPRRFTPTQIVKFTLVGILLWYVFWVAMFNIFWEPMVDHT